MTPATAWLTALGAVMLLAAVVLVDGSGRVGLFVAGIGLVGCALWGAEPVGKQPEG